MKLKSIKEIKNLAGKKVLLRTGFDVPISARGIVEKEGEKRIKEGLPTIQYLLKKKAIIIILNHLGRPEGKVVEKLRLDPIAKKLGQFLKRKVKKLDEIVGPKVESVIKRARPAEIIMLENIRFHPREEKNCQRLAKKLASLGNIYVNDAFSVSHRAHSSTVAITNFLPAYAGLLLEKEVKNLSQVLDKPKRPLVLVIGGVKISTKLGFLKKFLRLADQILLGGALANTVLKAQGIAVGRSIVEEEMVERLKKIKLTDTKLHLPVDVVVSNKPSIKALAKIKAVGNVRAKEWILDIGPDTTELYQQILQKAKTIIWNGPMGVFEIPQFAKGTKETIKAILNCSAKVIIGGGETLEAFQKYYMPYAISYKQLYLSTGGGAMLEFLEKGSLPAIKPLLKRKAN